MTDLLQVEVYLLRLIIPAVYWVKSLLACIMKNNIRAGRDLFMEKGQVRYRKGTPADLDDICSMIRDAVAEMEQSGIHQFAQNSYSTRAAHAYDLFSVFSFRGDIYFCLCFIIFSSRKGASF